jgi:P pilus assembly chaperone PapD
MNMTRNKKKFYIRKALPAIIGAGVFMAGIAQATFITPKRVMIEDKQRTATVTIHNTGDDTIAYRFDWEHRTFTPDGQSIRLESGQTSPGYKPADPFLQFSPRQVILKAKESQKLRILVRRPADMAAGEYHSHLLIKSERLNVEQLKPQPGMSGMLNVQTHASIPVFLRQGATTVDVKIPSAQMIDKDGREYLRYTIANNSTRSIFASPYVDCTTGSSTTSTQLSTARIYAEAKAINLDTLIPLGTTMKNCSAIKLRLVGIADFEYKNEKIIATIDVAR